MRLHRRVHRPSSHVEGFATQDYGVPGKTGEDFLQSERHPRTHQAQTSCQASGIVKPDGDEPQEGKNEGNEADALTCPEGTAPAGFAADSMASALRPLLME